MTNETKTEKNRPQWKLVQDKAYFAINAKGQPIRKSRQVEITRGWDEVGRESGVPYISWADSVTPVLPDVDGRIVLRAFPITDNENK